MTRATREMPKQRRARFRRHRRRGTLLLWLVTILGLLWIAYWYGASHIADAVIDRASSAAATRGYAIQCDEEASGGFPLSLDFSCSQASVAGGASRLSAAVEGLSATAPLYRPGRIEWVATGPFVLDAPANGIGLTATWRTAEWSVDSGLGGIAGARTQVEDLKIQLPPEGRPLPYAGVTLRSADLSITPTAGGAYRIFATANAIALEADDGRALPAINLEADLAALAVGDSLGVDPRRALRDWLSRGGKIRVDGLKLATDSVSATSSGSLALSPDGTLSGNLRVIMSGLDALPDLVEAFRPGLRERVAQLSAAVVAFTKPVGNDGAARELPLNIKNSVVSVGILPIGVIPKIAF